MPDRAPTVPEAGQDGGGEAGKGEQVRSGGAVSGRGIYFTPDNYGSGGCYNKDCAGFVQTDNSVYLAGDFDVYSTKDGEQREITLRWQKAGETGDWWLKYADKWVGYYPLSLFKDGAIRSYAGKVAVGGEIVNKWNLNLHTSTDMGSGSFASSGWQYASYGRLIHFWRFRLCRHFPGPGRLRPDGPLRQAGQEL